MRNLCLIAIIAILAFAQDMPPVPGNMPVERGYWSITAKGKSIGAAGYSLTMTEEGWDFDGWTLLNIDVGGKITLVRLFYSAELQPDMSMSEYSLVIGDTLEIFGEWLEGKIIISHSRRDTKSEEIHDNEISNQNKGAEIKGTKGSAKSTSIKSKRATAESISEKPEKDDTHSSTQKERNLIGSIDADISPFLLDTNIFGHWAIISKLIALESGSIANLALLAPQMSKIFNAQASVGHTEMVQSGTAYKVSFSGDGIYATAWVDSASRHAVKIELHREGFTADFSKECPDTSTLTALQLTEFFATPETNIECERLIENPLEMKTLTGSIEIEIAGKPLTKREWQDFNGRYENGIITGKLSVEKTSYSGRKSMKLDELSTIPAEMQPYLETTPNIPSHNKNIENMVINGNPEIEKSKTVWKYVTRLNRWIADNIKHQPEQDDAIVAAATQRGNPLARARLIVAALRSRGIPARVVGGIYYFGHVWLPHYWIEVWLGERIEWRPIDPSTGEDVNFTPIHITLFEGISTIGSGKLVLEKIK